MIKSCRNLVRRIFVGATSSHHHNKWAPVPTSIPKLPLFSFPQGPKMGPFQFLGPSKKNYMYSFYPILVQIFKIILFFVLMNFQISILDSNLTGLWTFKNFIFSTPKFKKIVYICYFYNLRDDWTWYMNF